MADMIQCDRCKEAAGRGDVISRRAPWSKVMMPMSAGEAGAPFAYDICRPCFDELKRWMAEPPAKMARASA